MFSLWSLFLCLTYSILRYYKVQISPRRSTAFKSKNTNTIMLKKNHLLMAVAINISISFFSHHITYINGFSQHSIVTLHNNNNIGTMKYHGSSSSQILQCPSPPHCGVTNQRSQTSLGSTTAKQEGNTNSNSSPSQQQGAKYNVLYQKVLRAANKPLSSSSSSPQSSTL